MQKQTQHASTVVGSTSTGGTTNQQGCDGFDDIIVYISGNLTAGSVTFTLQTSPDGTLFTQHPDTTATKTQSSAGAFLIVMIARAPIGPLYRVAYNITTGPVTFTIFPFLSLHGAMV